MLPSDRYLAELLGLTEAQYRHYQIEVRKRAAQGPQPAVVAGVETVIAIASLAIGIGSLAVSALLKPNIPSPGQAPGQPRQTQDLTDPIVRNTRFAPRYGFDSQQDIATLGSIIPVIYAKRESIAGANYGGIRINMPMLWNQILSLGGGQMLRGVFMLGEGTISSLDISGFAIGSNTIQSYIFDDSTAAQEGSRVTVYFSGDGGRIAGADRVLGRTNVNDDGSAGSSDVFQVYWDGQYRADFCSSHRPSTQTTFGVYAPIGNNFMYKVNPVIRPGVRSQYQSNTNDGRLQVDCPNDDQQLYRRDKYIAHFSTFSGVIGDGTEQAVAAGDSITYKLFSSSDWTTTFPSSGGGDSTVEARDVASAVASLQKTWDDRIIVGELYKIGDLLAVCTDRTPDDQFVSEADLEGSSVGAITITATFKALEAGSVKGYTEAYLTDKRGDQGQREKGTTGGHLLRYARAQISVTRACQAVEFGIKSNLGIRISNLCNFRDAKSYEFADTNYCEEFENADIDEIKSALYQSGVITSAVQRYSFFKIKYRDVSSSSWVTLTETYGVRSETQQSVFNYIRLEFDTLRQREFMFEPLSGFEIRNSRYGCNATLYVLDPKKGRITVTENCVTAVFNGEVVELNETNFGITYGRANPALQGDANNEYNYEGRTLKALPPVDANTYIDDYGRLAEAFVYPEITSSADNGPEHEIVYVNEIVPNDSVPQYNGIALVGINIRSSAEWQQFAQFSGYVTGGKECSLLLGGSGPTHLFPDVLYDLMTDTVHGAGHYIKPYMIDTASFTASAQWCQDRKYFYDAAVAERVNIRQWASDLAATHLLHFGEYDGKFFLRPAISSSPVTISGLFTAGNIAEGSFSLEYFDPEDRDPIQVSVRYREERLNSDAASPGRFPVVREVLVREGIASETDPIEQLDMTEYCTSCTHAVDAAKFLIRMRRIPTHVISFRTTHEGFSSRLNPGDYIKVAMDETEYDEFTNGVVTGSGALVSTTALDDGTYDVLAWDGVDGNEPADATLTVSDNGATATPTGIIFTVKKASTQIRVYQVERISPDDDGTFTIEAMYMPLNSSGVTKVAEDFDNNASWVITPPCSAISTTPDACVPTSYSRDCSPPLSGAGVWTLETTHSSPSSAFTRYYVIEIFEPFYNESGNLIERRIVQDNRSVTSGDVLSWTPNTDVDTFFSFSSRSVNKKEGISYWDPSNCPRGAGTNAGYGYAATYIDGVRDTVVTGLGEDTLYVNCDFDNASESFVLNYIGSGVIRDWWSVSALPGTISGGVINAGGPIPEPDLPGP